MRFLHGPLALAFSLCLLPACSSSDAPPDDDAASGDDAAVAADDATGGGDDAASEPDAAPPGCGSGPACAAPFVCASGGYCASATGVPAFEHIYVAIFENHRRDAVLGHAPYFDSLVAAGANASNYFAITHPSLPNYVAMTSGDYYDQACDCNPGATNDCNAITCTAVAGLCTCEHDVPHLADQMEAAGITWREYGEGMTEPCHSANVSATHFAARHIPFMYYANVLSDTARCTAHVRDFADFPADMGSYRFTMISPNLCSDMHDTCGGNAVTHGDDWASTNLAPILTQPGFAAGGRDVLFIVWDEEDTSLTAVPLPFIVVSPLVAAPGTVTAARYDHYALLATWEDALGLDRMNHAAAATPIADIWR